MTDLERYRRIWARANYKDQADAIVQEAVKKGDMEDLKWLWNQVSYKDQADVIIRKVTQKGDVNDLEWFWERATYKDQADKLLRAMQKLDKEQDSTGQHKEQASAPTSKRETSIPRAECEYDVFVCHAAEDKDAVARPLAQALRDKGLRVWYDEFTLRLGDSLSQSIDAGLASAKFGVVILSPSFFGKKWARKELDGLTEKETTFGKTILPIWHNVDKGYVIEHSPSLAGKLAVSTGEGLSKVVDEILKVISAEASRVH